MRRITDNQILRIAALLLLLAGVAYLSWRYMPQVTQLLKNPEQFKAGLLKYGYFSRVIFMALQIAQVVAAPLPGEIMQIVGGYVFGVIAGTIYSMAGILMGSMVAFYLARILGYPLLKSFISHEKLEHYQTLLNSRRAEVLVFIIFLIPGAPKDILTFCAGATPIRPGAFFLAAMLGRFPGILVSSLIGAELEKQQYLAAGLLSGAAAILFLLGILYKDRILHLIKHHHRIH